MGNAVAQVHPELNVLPQPSPCGPGEYLGHDVGGRPRLRLAVALDPHGTVVIDLAPLLTGALGESDGQAVPSGDEQPREGAGPERGHRIVPDPEGGEAGLSGLLQRDLPRLRFAPDRDPAETAHLGLQSRDPLALPRRAIGADPEDAAHETIEVAPMGGGITPGPDFQLALRLSPALIPVAQKPLGQLDLVVRRRLPHGPMIAQRDARPAPVSRNAAARLKCDRTRARGRRWGGYRADGERARCSCRRAAQTRNPGRISWVAT